jgi:crotonobetainyl-CoA:carnitine CoA-transferase CaiB-like acyl-CoA transferase
VGTYDAWAAEGFADADLARLRTNRALSQRVKAALQDVFATRSAAEWEAWANPDCDLVECQTTEEWLLYDVQARLAEAVITLDDPDLGLTHQVGYAVSMSKTPPRAAGPRHRVDADRAAILAELQTRQLHVEGVRNGHNPPALRTALEGFKALDAAQVLAGPTACRILAEYGADVVQIVNPHGRAGRAYHYQVDSGKRTLLLDLKQPGALDVFWKLVEQADVLSTNFSPAVAQRLGVDEATVRQHQREIIYSRISAHGMVGPRSEYRGHEQVGQSVTGMQVRYGQDAPHPIMQPFAVNDAGTGHLGAFAILLALYHRLRTGEGQYVGASLAQTAAVYQTPYMVAHKRKAWEEPGGLQCRGKGPLERLYQAGDGRWLFVAAPDATALSGVPGLEGLALLEPAALEAFLENRFRQAPVATWVERFTAAGVGAHLNTSIEEAMDDGWAREHGVTYAAEFPQAGSGLLVGPAPRLSLTPMHHGFPANPVGWEAVEVVREIGLADRLDELERSGAIIVPEAARVLTQPGG